MGFAVFGVNKVKCKDDAFKFISSTEGKAKAVLITEAAKGGTFNIACGGSHTLLELVALINHQLGTEIEPEFIDTRQGDVRHSNASIDAALTLGYVPRVAFDEGVKRTVDFMRNEIDLQ